MKPVCLVIGAGAGIGGNVGKRFAREGYHAVLCRRSDAEGLRHLVDGIEKEGGSASGFLLDAAKAGMGKQSADEIAASLKQKFPVFTKEELLTDMEYGGTPLSRAVINVNVAFQELGKK